MHRGDVDYAAAATLLDHLLGRDLRAEEGALEVDRHDPVILVFGGVEDRRARFDAGIVHHDVELTERAHSLVDKHLQIGETARVGFDANRPITESGDLLFECLGRLRMAHIIDNDFGTQPSEFENYRLADPTVAAGDNGNFAP